MITRLSRVSAALCVSVSTVTSADEQAGGDFYIDLRYRLEHAAFDAVADDATASTLRTRIGYLSRDYSGFSYNIEVDNVANVGGNAFNSTRNGTAGRPVIADPSGTGLNQAWVAYKTPANAFKLGRQRINFDNQRFIGGVAWRQNEQTFDALRWTNNSFNAITLDYSYVDKVHRIFGPDSGSPADELESDSHFLHAMWKPTNNLNVSAYSYLLEFDNAPALSTSTLGIRAVGKIDWSDALNFAYVGEIATQSDYGNNPVSYDARYYHLEAIAHWSGWSFGAGVESLEGDSSPGRAFRTPLATLHKFQGWTDLFLTTPAQGIDDIYVSAKTQFFGFNWALVYHDLDAQTGGTDYGSEWNLLVTRKLGEYGTLLIKAAHYSADEFGSDGQRYWIQHQIAF